MKGNKTAGKKAKKAKQTMGAQSGTSASPGVSVAFALAGGMLVVLGTAAGMRRKRGGV